MGIEQSWNRLPAPVRWALLFPVAFLVVVIAGLCIKYAVRDLPDFIFPLIFPPIMALVYLWILHKLAPSGKTVLLVIMIALRAILIPVFLIGLYLSSKGLSVDVSWNGWLVPMIGEGFTLVASIGFLMELRRKQAKSPDVHT